MKLRNQTRTRSSEFFQMFELGEIDGVVLPCERARIAFRDMARSKDERTIIACLLPPGVILTNKAPYLLRQAGDERDEAFVLGVISSIPFDWFARLFVELGVSFHIFRGLPVPIIEPDDARRIRLVEVAGRLAARDDRFAEWAEAVGVPVGSVTTSDQRSYMEGELDALVAHLYGLSRDQVEHVFETFHRGWDYKPRLDVVLEHFDAIGS